MILLLYRKRRYGRAFRKIKLTRGKYAKVSQEDFARMNKDRWYVTTKNNQTFYAVRMIYAGGRKKQIQMHRAIMNPEKNLVVDHRDGDGLNNTRGNLRIATQAENCYNKRKCRNKRSSQYKGVSYRKRDKKWTAVITFKGISINLGMFEDEIEAAKAYDEAAKAYDEAARELYREYAHLNFS